MILGDRTFKKLEDMLSVKDSNKIDFILIDYQYKREKNKVKLLNQFIPIYNDIRIKRKSGTQIGVTQSQLKDVMLISPALLVYDKKRYEKVKNSNLEEVVLNTIKSLGNEERYNRVVELLNRENINITNYTEIAENEKFLKILSNSLHIQTIYKYIITELSELDKHFLQTKQVLEIVQSLSQYDVKVYESLNAKKQKEYIADLYKNMDKTCLYINTDITKNITNILNKYDTYDILKKYFFDDDEYLNTIDNIFDKKIVPTPSVKKIMLEIDNLIENFIFSNTKLQIHVSAITIQKEILTKVKYVNLYSYEDNYGVELYKNSLEKLYKRISKNRLATVEISNDSSNYYKQKLEESAYYKFKMSDIKYEHTSMIIIEMENHYDGVSDIDKYKKAYVESKIKNEEFYEDYMKNNNIDTPNYQDIIDAKVQRQEQIYKNDFLSNHYILEKEFEENIVEEYIKVSKKDAPIVEEEEDYIQELRESIPTTKRVKGKPKKLKKAEIETILQKKIVQHKQEQDSKKSNEAFSENFDESIATESELESILDDFYKPNNKTDSKSNSQDLFYNIMKLGLEE